jgi:hypothetical protein
MKDSAELQGAGRETYFTRAELAKLYKLSPNQIRDMFIDEPGVIRIGHASTRKKRQYYTLRIPASVADRVFSRMRVGA